MHPLRSLLVAALLTVAYQAKAGLFAPEPGELRAAELSTLPTSPLHQGELWYLTPMPFPTSCAGCPTPFPSNNGTVPVNAYVAWGALTDTRDFIPHPGGWEFRHVKGGLPSESVGSATDWK